MTTNENVCIDTHKSNPQEFAALGGFLGFVGLTSCQAICKDSNQLCLHKEIQRVATLWIFTIDKS